MIPETEVWKDIPGLVGFYQASDKGRIRSVSRMVRARGGKFRPLNGRVLTIQFDRYAMVMISAEGRSKTGLVHRLVCSAFHGEPPLSSSQAAHNDGNRHNNSPENLRWASPKENMADRKIHGTTIEGERVNTAKLKEEDIPAIFSLSDAGLSSAHIARRYGVSKSTIGKAIRGDTWKHVHA